MARRHNSPVVVTPRSLNHATEDYTTALLSLGGLVHYLVEVGVLQ